MKSSISIIFTFALTFMVSAHSDNSFEKSEDIAWTAGSYCTLKSSQVDEKLPSNKSKFQFDFKFPDSSKNAMLHYSIDGKEVKTRLDKANRLNLIVSPGKHIFQFYIEGYIEAFSDSLLIEACNRDEYDVQLQAQRTINAVSYKPVIYLYPEKETAVTTAIDIIGTDAFLYPPSDGKWEFTAHPNGDLKFGDAIYNYLFWEANSTKSLPISDVTSGFYVAKDEVVSFLEEKLTEANLSSKEKADFITFWGPQLAQNEMNFVHFVFNEECDRYATLTIDPKPKSIYRIYMIYAAVGQVRPIPAQKIKAVDRNEFYVIEWGGQHQVMPQKIAHINY